MWRSMRESLGAVSLGLFLVAPAAAGDVFESDLIPCTEALCALAAEVTLREGRVDVDEDGRVGVELVKAASGEGVLAETTLDLCFQPFGEAKTSIGELTTDVLGDADDSDAGSLEASSSAGLFLLVDGSCLEGAPLFVSGFSTFPEDDADSDGIPDDEDSDDDDDGIPDDEDSDDDNDGIPDVDEDELDNDSDGIANDEDSDDDNDGVPDIDDLDDDNDGIPDSEDADPDDANLFDDVADEKALKNAFKSERRALRDDAKAAMREEKAKLEELRQELKKDFDERRDDFEAVDD